MKRTSFFKLSLALLVVITTVIIFSSVYSFASPVKVTFKQNGSTSDILVEAGEAFTPEDITVLPGQIFYGWIDSNGNIYQAGKSITVTEATTFYALIGCEVSSEGELLASISQKMTYVKMTSSFVVNDSIELNNGALVLDTNGCNLTVATEDSAFTSFGTGISVIGGGKVIHTYSGTAPAIDNVSLVKFEPSASTSSMFVTVESGTTVSTRADLIIISANISSKPSAFNAAIHGTVECNKLMVTNGISDGIITVHKTASVSTTDEFLFEDRGSFAEKNYVTLKILGGTFNFDRLNGIARQSDKYKVYIQGAPQFSQDISSFFDAGNYSFAQNKTTGMYHFVRCEHSGPVSGDLPNCGETDVVVTYRCLYCDMDYTKTIDKMEHDIVTVVLQPMITTEETTQELIYEKKCVRCGGNYSKHVEYPDPSTVYVTVTYLDEKGRPHDLRVPSKEMFTFVSMDTSGVANTKYNGKCYLMAFGTEILEYGEKYKSLNIKQKNIVSVEIPLGTKKIFGDQTTHSSNHVTTYAGVFYLNNYLREIALPKSLTDIERHAFREMESLTNIKGLEYVTGTIHEYAFYQKHQNVIVDQMALNAYEIKDYAFNNVRMNHLFIGLGVKKIQKGAFHLDNIVDNPSIRVSEVFVEGNTVNGTTFPTAFKGTGRTYVNDGQQFGATRNIVFTEHQVNSVVTEPSCLSGGYTTHTCKYCSYVRVDTELPALGHAPDEVVVAPTCSTQGYTVEMCTRCGEEYGDRLINQRTDPNNHMFGTKEGYVFFDEETGDFIFYNTSEKAFYTKEGVRVNKEFFVCENIHYKVKVCEGKRCYGIPEWDSVPADADWWTSPSLVHSPDESKRYVAREPNCGEPGLALIPCSLCTKELEETLPVTGSHKSPIEEIVQAPNCTSQGFAQSSCPVCGEIWRYPVEKDPKNHDWNNGTVIKQPTENTRGVLRISCNRCSQYFDEGIDRLPPSAEEQQFPTWIIICIAVGGVLLVGGIVLTLYFTFFKKKRASDNYTYKFNTLKK